MSNIGVSINGGGSKKPKDPYNFYPTPPEPTRALVRHYREVIGAQTILEMSCGEGHMARIIREELPTNPLLAIDIYHRGFGMGGIDFTKLPNDAFGDAPPVGITNPPFNQALAFIEKAHILRLPFFALYLKQTFWNAAKTGPTYDKYPPKAQHPLQWRVDFTGAGSPTMDTMWCVWGDDVPISTQPFKRPK